MTREKFQIEYNIKTASLNLLWQTISTPTGLENWFADNVTVKDKIYTFTWGKSSQEAELISIRMGSFIRFRWLEDLNEKCYFEFKITVDEITDEGALIITDFADKEDQADVKILWDKQIKDLFRNIGL
ncbi:MAG: hypothetical protein JXQ69_06665 [Paludibacteraceae bacterium]|nr:hypothetical protein [Paludibacteraceae bacterium]MBN2787988.1 hypothetical protein [Paludibacteraceae bacterium]